MTQVNRRGLLLLISATAVLLFLSTAFAAPGDTVGSPKTSFHDREGSDSPTKAGAKGDSTGILKKGGDNLQSLMSDSLKEYKNTFMSYMFAGCNNPGGMKCADTTHPVIQTVGRIIMQILVPLYMVLILLVAVYFIWGATAPRVRTQAKSMLQKLIMGLVFSGLAFPMYDMLLELNNFIVHQILTIGGVPVSWDPIVGMGPAAAGAGMATGAIALIAFFTFGIGWPLILGIICMILAMIFLPYLVLAVRYNMVLVFGALFPFTIFCLAFDFLKGIGYKLAKWTITWAMMPIPMSVFIVLSWMILQSPFDYLNPGPAIAALIAYMLIGLSPMMITGMLSTVGSGTIFVAQTTGSARLAFVGYVMQGYGGQAFTQAAYIQQRSDARLEGPRESAAGHSYPDRGGGPPSSAATSQPHSPWGGHQPIGQGPDGEPPMVYGSALGGREREVGGWGDVSWGERATRAAFGTAVTAGTRPDEMTAQQYYGVRYATSRSGWSKAYWLGMGLAANLSPKLLLVPVGYALRGFLRHSIGDWGVGRTLLGASYYMTGWWTQDSRTGEQKFNYGVHSFRGVRRNLARGADNLYKSYEEGGSKGAPPMVSAAMTAVGIALPVAILAAPGLGMSITGFVGVAALTTAIGAKILQPAGKTMREDEEFMRQLSQRPDDGSPSFTERLAEMGDQRRQTRQQAAQARSQGRRGPANRLDRQANTMHEPLRDELWGKMSDDQKKRFGWDPGMAAGSPEETAAKENAFNHYARELQAGLHTVNAAGQSQADSMGWGNETVRDQFVNNRQQHDTRVTNASNSLNTAQNSANTAQTSEANAQSAYDQARQNAERDVRNSRTWRGVDPSTLDPTQRALFDQHVDQWFNRNYNGAQLTANLTAAQTANQTAQRNLRVSRQDQSDALQARDQAYTQGRREYRRANQYWNSLDTNTQENYIEQARTANPNADEEGVRGIALANAYQDGLQRFGEDGVSTSGADRSRQVRADALWNSGALTQEERQNYMTEGVWSSLTSQQQTDYLNITGGNTDSAKRLAFRESTDMLTPEQLVQAGKTAGQLALNDKGDQDNVWNSLDSAHQEGYSRDAVWDQLTASQKVDYLDQNGGDMERAKQQAYGDRTAVLTRAQQNQADATAKSRAMDEHGLNTEAVRDNMANEMVERQAVWQGLWGRGRKKHLKAAKSQLRASGMNPSDPNFEAQALAMAQNTAYDSHRERFEQQQARDDLVSARGTVSPNKGGNPEMREFEAEHSRTLAQLGRTSATGGMEYQIRGNRVYGDTGEMYTIEGDRVFRHGNSWGAERREVTGGAAAAIREWHSEQTGAAAPSPHMMSDTDWNDRFDNGLMDPAATGISDRQVTGVLDAYGTDLDRLDTLKGLAQRTDAQQTEYDQLAQSLHNRIIGYDARRAAPWRRNMRQSFSLGNMDSRDQNRTQSDNMLDFFMEMRRRQNQGNWP
ncbi:MAG: hypothetical protein GF416_02350 [Candidatus Altiarchaeales archaeon]|nr:hypothetical protein [Candidatus Altiarchaeales archaeon]MBD3415960.1 hypothetical protein [Candidatus Altiarchaeales archaeon]